MTDITDEQFHDLIREECAQLAEFLVEKNIHYGNAVLRPRGVFSNSLNPIDKILVRMDDKMDRMLSGSVEDNEDAPYDFTGYVVLKRAVTRALGGEVASTESGTLEAPKTKKPAPKTSPKAAARKKKAEAAVEEAPPFTEASEEETLVTSVDDIMSGIAPTEETPAEPTPVSANNLSGLL